MSNKSTQTEVDFTVAIYSDCMNQFIQAVKEFDGRIINVDPVDVNWVSITVNASAVKTAFFIGMAYALIVANS